MRDAGLIDMDVVLNQSINHSGLFLRLSRKCSDACTQPSQMSAVFVNLKSKDS